jgi:hypothetical protein
MSETTTIARLPIAPPGPTATRITGETICRAPPVFGILAIVATFVSPGLFARELSSQRSSPEDRRGIAIDFIEKDDEVRRGPDKVVLVEPGIPIGPVEGPHPA